MQVQALHHTHMDVDGMVTENDKNTETGNPVAPTDPELDAFWKENRLLHRKAELAAFLGTETMIDLIDVHPRDLKTVRFAMWADNTLTIAEANRLRRALYAHHAKHNPRGDQTWHHGPNAQLPPYTPTQPRGGQASRA